MFLQDHHGNVGQQRVLKPEVRGVGKNFIIDVENRHAYVLQL